MEKINLQRYWNRFRFVRCRGAEIFSLQACRSCDRDEGLAGGAGTGSFVPGQSGEIVAQGAEAENGLTGCSDLATRPSPGGIRDFGFCDERGLARDCKAPSGRLETDQTRTWLLAGIERGFARVRPKSALRRSVSSTAGRPAVRTSSRVATGPVHGWPEVRTCHYRTVDAEIIGQFRGAFRRFSSVGVRQWLA